MRSLILSVMFASMIVTLPAFAANPWNNGTWAMPADRVVIGKDEISVDGVKYPIGKEVIVDSYGVNAQNMDGHSSSECRAETRLASITSKGELVLVMTYRSKETLFFGVLCGLSRDINGYSAPYSFQQIVLTPSAKGGFIMKKYFFSNGPKVSIQEMQNPRLTEENAAVKEYMKSHSWDFPSAALNHKAETGANSRSPGVSENRRKYISDDTSSTGQFEAAPVSADRAN